MCRIDNVSWGCLYFFYYHCFHDLYYRKNVFNIGVNLTCLVDSDHCCVVMHERCWTAERRFHHGLQDSDCCIICDQATETMHHLLHGCIFSREVWAIWLRKLRLDESMAFRMSTPCSDGFAAESLSLSKWVASIPSSS